jgi:thymidylate kinase
VTSPGPPRLPGRAVEVVGPPGAGKSTLTAALARAYQRVAVVERYGGGPGLAGLMRSAAAVVAVAGPETDRQRLRWMARLEASAGVLERRRGDAPVVLFDQGPVYTMARLWGSAGAAAARRRYARWFDVKLRLWGDLLDLVVVLDAPDEVLLARIRGREKPHATKAAPDPLARAVVGRERAAYAGVLGALGALGSGPVIVRLDGRCPVEEMVATTLRAVTVGAAP